MSMPPCAADDRLDLDAVCRAHGPMVRRALRQLGVGPAALDDATQDVFLVLLRRLEDFDRSRSLTNWLWGIAKGVASTHRRTRWRRDRLATRLSATALDSGRPVDPHEQVVRREAGAMLDAFLRSLDDDKCAVFVLAELEGCSGPEIAARLQLNVNTVYARLRAARLRLREVAGMHRPPAWHARLAAWLGWPGAAGAKPVSLGASAVLGAALVTPVALERPSSSLEVRPEPALMRSAQTRDTSVPAKGMGEPRAVAPTPIVVALEEEHEMIQNHDRFAHPLALAASVAIAGMLSTPAHAKPKAGDTWRVQTSDQDADEAARVEGDGPTTEYIFDNDHLEGEVLNPDGTMVLHRRSPKMPSMLSLRAHFVPELIRLGSDI